MNDKIEITTDRIIDIEEEFLYDLITKFNFNTKNPLYLVMLTERRKRKIGFDQKLIITDNHFTMDAQDVAIDVIKDLKRVSNDELNPEILYKLFE